ncbi:MAG: 3-hydroxyanthranilate 3,4-dioxygenase [Bernardetiaceae bacterium]
MALSAPFHLQQWINEHRHLLRPPVGNQQIYTDNSDYIVMIVGGPNARKDYHYNEGEELFYQIEGTITLKIMDEGKARDIEIKAGEMFLLPPRIPHSPQRGPHTIGLVIERYRKPNEKDGFIWYCESCGHQLHQTYFAMTDIVAQLPRMMEEFYGSQELRTCTACGTIMEPPQKNNP